jgi:hypothetical protein
MKFNYRETEHRCCDNCAQVEHTDEGVYCPVQDCYVEVTNLCDGYC